MTEVINEKPIVFDANEVKAVLAGHKTQHRMPVLTEQQVKSGYEWDFGADGDVAIFYKYANDGISIEETLLIDCPFGATGDRLWVQEPSLIHCDWDWFYADNTLVECNEPFTPNDLHLLWDDKHQEYKGAVGAEYLPRWASRILLEITDIHIERAQGITHNDSVKEAAFTFYPKQAVPPLSAFPRYWMAKHGGDAWRLNPWVWVIEFKKAEG